LIPSAAISAEKISNGSACKTLKQRVKVGGKYLVCAKVGNKRVWSLEKSGALPTPTATKEAASFITDQSKWGVQDAAIPAASFPDVEKIASEEFFKGLPAENSGLTVNIWFEDNIDSAIQDIYREQILYVAKKYSGYFTRTNRIDVIGYTNKAWAIKTLLSIDKNAGDLPGFDMTTALVDNPQCDPKINVPTGWTMGAMKSPLVVMPALNCMNPATRGTPEVPSHELTHAVQVAVLRTLAGTDGSSSAPQWMVEGQAQVGSNFLNYYNGALHPSHLFCGGARTLKYKKYRSNWLKSLEIRDEEGQNQEYGIGMLGMEYLIARSGWEKSLQVSVLAASISLKQNKPVFRNLDSFNLAFKTIYGQSLNDFYDEVQLYLKWLYDNGSEYYLDFCNGKW
jgi:hypothetical protein